MHTTKAETVEIGISIITSTNKPDFINNILFNYINQRWGPKELIVVLNNDSMNLSEWTRKTEDYPSIKIYQLPERESLGACLNFAEKKSKYEYIAKFDDDDYYSPHYLAEAMRAFRRTKADMLGKRSYYMYMINKKVLMLRHPAKENRWCPLIAGGTIIAKRKVFRAVPFVDQKVGTAFRFVADSRKKGFRIYSTSRFNYTYLRRDDKNHTWNPNPKYFLNTSKIVAVTLDYRDYVNKKEF